jgi:hypothetical protein
MRLASPYFFPFRCIFGLAHWGHEARLDRGVDGGCKRVQPLEIPQKNILVRLVVVAMYFAL